MAQYGPALRAYFRKKAGAAEAEDLVQDVFVAMQARGGVEDIEHVGRYLFRVAANVLARRAGAGGTGSSRPARHSSRHRTERKPAEPETSWRRCPMRTRQWS